AAPQRPASRVSRMDTLRGMPVRSQERPISGMGERVWRFQSLEASVGVLAYRLCMTQRPTQMPAEVAEQVGFYVYLLRDPRDGQVFYVGKGQGSRVLSHVREASADPVSEGAKEKRINDIHADGRQVEHL